MGRDHRDDSSVLGSSLKNHHVTVIVPCHKPEGLNETLDSLLRQTFSPQSIIVVADGVELAIQNNPIIQVIQNKKRIGKAASINSVIPSIETDLCLMIDCDTTLETHSLERMVEQISGEVEVVIPRIMPKQTVTLFQKSAAKSYDHSFKTGSFRHILGPCILTKTSIIRNTPLPTETMVEDQHWSYLLFKKGVGIFNMRFPTALTDEPKSLQTNLRRMVRWSYGTYQLECIKNPLVNIYPYFWVVIPLFLTILSILPSLPSAPEMHDQFSGLRLLVGYSFFAFMFIMQIGTQIVYAMKSGLLYGGMEMLGYYCAVPFMIIRKRPPW